jgi:HD-GYP domain-containing protein (c-di-GMP phosphodiesterase class II)
MTAPEVLLTAIDKAFSEEKPGTLRWAFAVSLDILFFSKPLKQTLKYISRDAKLTESAFDRLTKFEIDLFKEEMLKKILIKVEDFWEKHLDSLVKNLTKTLGKEQMEGAARAYFKVGIKGLGEVAYILRTNKDAQKMFAMVYLDFKSIGLSEEAAALIAFNVVAYEIKGGLGHSTRLAILSYLTARNLSLKELTRVRILGYIHDFGKGATIPKEGNLGKNIRGLEPTHNPEGALTDFGRTVIQEGHIISSYHLLENIAELIGREEAQKLFMFLGEGNINTGSRRASEIILKHHPTSLGNTIDSVRRDMLFFSLLDIADAVSSYRLYRNLSAEGAAAIIIRHAINYFGRNEALALLATKNVFLALAHYAGKEVNEELLERALERIFNKLRQRGADFLNLTNLSYELIVETAKNESVLIEIIKAYREKMANESSSILSMYK